MKNLDLKNIQDFTLIKYNKNSKILLKLNNVKVGVWLVDIKLFKCYNVK